MIWAVVYEHIGLLRVVNIMRSRSLIYACAAFVIVVCRTGLSLESPVGSGTVPPTTYRSGLVPSKNPIDTSGNLVVTGNVAGEAYFRGVVPYGGVTNFSLPTSTLANTSGAFDSFMRRTTGSQSFEQSGGGLTPYYSPTLTVTTQIPGTRGVVTSQATGGYGAESFYGAALPQAQTGYYQQGNVLQVRTRPLSMSQMEMEKRIQDDAARIPLGGEPVTEVQLLERFWREIGVQIEQRQKPAEDEGKKAGPYGLEVGNEPDIRTLLGLKKELEKQPAATGQEGNPQQLANMAGRGPELDVYEQMKKQLVEPATGLEGLTEGIEGIIKPVTGQAPRLGSGQAEPNKPADGVTKAGTSAIVRTGVGEVYKSFTAFSDDKFNKYIRAAESYMKQGRFYRAADAYTLATAYKPNDPLGYAGKSIALFASGEYMSSSLFLARALEIFPEYAKFKVDLIGMIGDKDTIENSILNVREWSTRSDSGELEFLLSYVYYQLDRMEFARLMIESAVKKMPDSTAVAAMKKAIDERTAKP
jgi:tetratricopeptide (TPR) repeat protein